MLPVKDYTGDKLGQNATKCDNREVFSTFTRKLYSFETSLSKRNFETKRMKLM
jgi:hypothetical protein